LYLYIRAKPITETSSGEALYTKNNHNNPCNQSPAPILVKTLPKPTTSKPAYQGEKFSDLPNSIASARRQKGGDWEPLPLQDGLGI
jgi:hypothetical protein